MGRHPDKKLNGLKEQHMTNKELRNPDRYGVDFT